MEAIIFVGAPGSGKSSFYKNRFFNSHVRISLDLLKTRHRERTLLQVCLNTQQKIVIDNTNPTRAERQVYITAARAAKYRIVGYYFQSKVEDCLRRNQRRSGAEHVPDAAILGIAGKLELPAYDEGFDQLCYVRISETAFVVEEWRDEIQ